MNRGKKKQRFVLCCITILIMMLPVACTRQRQQEKKSESQPSPAEAADIWVSETTGKEYRVQVQNDVISAEWLNVSPEMAKQGAFIRTVCKREGHKWLGTSSSYLPCTTGGGAKPKLDNWCHLDTKMEIDSITAESISGRGEALINFDCMKCQILNSDMKDFLWSPKEAAPK